MFLRPNHPIRILGPLNGPPNYYKKSQYLYDVKHNVTRLEQHSLRICTRKTPQVLVALKALVAHCRRDGIHAPNEAEMMVKPSAKS